MAEEIAQVEQGVEPQAEPQGEAKHETDWKAESRKWEARAKKSEAAEKELAELKMAQMTEQERITARAEAAEKELAEMKAERERIASAREIAENQNVPRELLEYCADRESMEKFAEAYKAIQPKTPIAPTAATSRIVRDGSTQLQNRDIFAAFAKEQGL